MYILVMDSTEFGLHLYSAVTAMQAINLARVRMSKGDQLNIYDRGIRIYNDRPACSNLNLVCWYNGIDWTFTKEYQNIDVEEE